MFTVSSVEMFTTLSSRSRLKKPACKWARLAAEKLQATPVLGKVLSYDFFRSR
jgi:hypothetical protein